MTATDGSLRPVPVRPEPARHGARAPLGLALTVLSMLGFAAMDTMSKLIVQDYPIGQALFIRYVIFALFAVLFVGPHRLRAAIRSARPLLQTGRSLLQIVEAAVFVLAFSYLPLADVHAIAAASPLIVVALSAPLLGERLDLPRLLAVVVGFAGVLVIVRPGFQVLSWPLLAPIVGAFLWGYYQILVRLCSRYDGADTMLLWSAFVGLAAAAVAAPWGWRPPDTQGWVLLLALGLLGALSHLALIKALAFAEAGAIQPFTYTLLVWVTLFGFLVFGDLPDSWTILGAGVVLLGGLYSWRLERAASTEPRQEPESVRVS